MQIAHDKRAREILVKGGRSSGKRLLDWEVTLMFYEIVIAVDGYAEIRGIPVPKNHAARSALVKRHLPYLADMYNGLYGLSLEARYYDGHNMAEYEGRRAARCYKALAGSIPV